MKLSGKIAPAGMFAFASAAVLLASACDSSTTSPSAAVDSGSATETGAAEAQGPDAKPGILASEGRLVLPAIAGRPGAAYFTLRNNGPKPTRVVSAYVSGTDKAEMHDMASGSMAASDGIDLPAGAVLAFAPGGRHVMVYGIEPGLAAGGKAEMTLTFADGDKLSMPLTVEKMGVAETSPGDPMAAMHGDHH